jgi:mRNA-degrading endonuclease RelE of RelBE toxin-antitoxin system
MEFRIADTFTDSLARLTGDEQKAVKTTAFDLQLNPAKPGMSFHRLDKARDRNFWSVRASGDLRLIVHRNDASLLLCYVDHHDKAYEWAERRKLETHPRTGAAQLVEIRETVKEIVVPSYLAAEPPAAATNSVSGKPIFAGIANGELLGYGVPLEWLADVKAATEETLLGLSEHLPAEAAEALLEIATGGQPRPSTPFSSPIGQRFEPFEHPDARRRFRVMTNLEELQRALDFPWEKWTVFLHPDQRQLVERDYNGPARLRFGRHRQDDCCVASRGLSRADESACARVARDFFRYTRQRLAHAAPSLDLQRTANRRAHRGRIAQCGGVAPVRGALRPAHDRLPATIRELITDAATAVTEHKFGPQFLVSEWEQVADAWQLESWEAYRDVPRLGRKTRLPEARRKILWTIFARVRSELHLRGLITWSGLFSSLATTAEKNNPPSDYAIIDEAQDISIAQLRFLAALGGVRANALFFAGDQGQRIFQPPFSWKALGVDIRGRSRTLRVNYRTSHQIRTQADRLLDPAVTDVDGNKEFRGDTISVFNGPPPEIRIVKDEHEEITAVAGWIAAHVKGGLLPHEFGEFVRSAAQLDRALAAVKEAGLEFKVLDEHVETAGGHVSISTMHLAKGLEFRAVAVIACDEEVIPSKERIASAGDDADLREVYETERHLLYVACTRARDNLLITGIAPASEFIDDLAPGEPA